ncbi:hypothetical protein [Larkinella punicea]|uniref:Outer membrane protein beta-barrel domain-containing protein n=1 Tax=Larkinella punicea TaxID=2315727 RepID=A0A368JNF9_9BACT|nr:hypothetical protein [Larkinella punicea]RCR67681.1 hypothetical protein DUE52_19945 [Larkinella punicea]
MCKKLAFILSAAFLMLLSSDRVQAQKAFEQGRIVGTAGLLLESNATPVTIAVEYGVTDEIGVAGKVVYQSSKGYSAYSLGVLGNYHLAKAFSVTGNKFDPFLGIHIGKPFASRDGRTASGSVFAGAQLGARYLVNERIGPYAQLNLGLVNSAGSSFELGAAFKFGN